MVIIGSLSDSVFARRTSTGKVDFLHHSGVVSLKLSGKSSFSNTSLLASRHIKREKASLPVDVRRSKTSLLKVVTRMDTPKSGIRSETGTE